jgi:hypothetical protein
MVATYDRHGIRFAYPENWELSEDYQGADSHCVTLQSPQSGFWMLQALETTKSADMLAAEALQSVKQEYGEVEVVRVDEEIEGTWSVGYDMLFYCLDFIVSAKVRSFLLEHRRYVLLWQAEDNEFEHLDAVFSAITASLLNPAKLPQRRHARSTDK